MTPFSKIILVLFVIFAHSLANELIPNDTPADKPIPNVIFDLSTLPDDNLNSLSVRPNKNQKKPTTTFKDGVLYPSANTSSSIDIPLHSSIPQNSTISFEGLVQFSEFKNPVDSGNSIESILKKEEKQIAEGIRFGFKTQKSKFGINILIRAAPKSKKTESSGLRVQILSGPLPVSFKSAVNKSEEDLAINIENRARTGKASERADFEKNARETVFSEEIKSIQANAPFHFKLVANGTTGEIETWINHQLIFKGKSAYDGIEGEICPFQLIDTFFVSFENQNTADSPTPDYVKSLTCYYHEQ